MIIVLLLITLSVFRLAVRRMDLTTLIPLLEPAPVSEKPVGLNRSPRPPGLWALNAVGSLACLRSGHSEQGPAAVPAGPPINQLVPDLAK